jgi:hypothetical protein
LNIRTQKDRSRSPSKHDQNYMPISSEKNENAIKMLKNLTVKPQNTQNHKLLQLENKFSEKEIEQTRILEDIQKADVVPTRETSKPPVQMVNKEVEVEKPLYDGYILKPGTFDEMLPKEKSNEETSTAETHYHATQHLRDKVKIEAQVEKLKNRKDIFTMTDNLSNVNNLAPDILFKLKFDPMKKGREENINNFELEKDFVNVADLNSDAVQDMLKLIENEQNKRTGALIVASSSKPSRLPVVIPDEKKDEVETNVLSLKSDALTEKLLSDEKELNYDLMHQNLLASNARSKSRQAVLNEFKLMDEKIKIMNDIAGEIGNDYVKYNKIVDTIQDFNKIIDMTHDYPVGSKGIHGYSVFNTFLIKLFLFVRCTKNRRNCEDGKTREGR